MARILFVITEDWALVSHRLHLVQAAIEAKHEVGIATNVTKFADLFGSMNIKVYDWPLRRRSLNIFAELKSIVRLDRIVQNFNPNLIHAVAQKPIIYSGLICRFRSRAKLLATLGGVGFIFSSKRMKARFLKYLVVIFFKIIFSDQRCKLSMQNQDNIDMFVTLGILENKDIVLIKGSGVEIEKFLPSEFPGGTPIIILPARLLWDKGVNEFVKTAHLIKSESYDVRFVLVGEPDFENPESIPKKELDEWVNSGLIEHWGRKEKMEEIYPQARIICLPSYHEGLPKALLEAASCARPVVAFDVPGCREIVRNDVNGKLVPFGDLQGLKDSIIEIIENPLLAKKFGLKGREIVAAEFSSQNINKQVFNVWKELIECDE